MHERYASYLRAFATAVSVDVTACRMASTMNRLCQSSARQAPSPFDHMRRNTTPWPGRGIVEDAQHPFRSLHPAAIVVCRIATVILRKQQRPRQQLQRDTVGKGGRRGVSLRCPVDSVIVSFQYSVESLPPDRTPASSCTLRSGPSTPRMNRSVVTSLREPMFPEALPDEKAACQAQTTAPGCPSDLRVLRNEAIARSPHARS